MYSLLESLDTPGEFSSTAPISGRRRLCKANRSLNSVPSLDQADETDDDPTKKRESLGTVYYV